MQITSDSREIVTAQLSWMHKYIIAGKSARTSERVTLHCRPL